MAQTTIDSGKTRPIIGRSALINFPELNLSDVPAKTDTGAYRSALHAQNIEVKEADGKKILSFDAFAGHPNAGQSSHFETDTFREVEIENSFGHRENRYEVMILCQLEGKSFRTSFTLANRGKKTYPVLMGRRLLNRRFMVDTTITHVDRQLLREKFKVDMPVDEEEGSE